MRCFRRRQKKSRASTIRATATTGTTTAMAVFPGVLRPSLPLLPGVPLWRLPVVVEEVLDVVCDAVVPGAFEVIVTVSGGTDV